MKIILTYLFLYIATILTAQNIKTDVLIFGGGASGTMAATQAARMGASTVVVEEGPWLGGMLTAAGVSAVDGNYRLHSGLWEEFRQNLAEHYGHEDSLKTGWVSNVLFEPQIGEKILSNMLAAESNIQVLRETSLRKISQQNSGWKSVVIQRDKTIEIDAKIVIDATELGDIAKRVGIPYNIGMDSRFDTKENIAPEKANDIIQDLTYVAILKDYGANSDKTIEKPAAYNPEIFYCTCAGKCKPNDIGRTLWPCDKMMTYGKLPNNYYMINWPIYGNDYYTNAIELSPEKREEEFGKAKDFTLQYLYYLQNELGYKNFGIADDVYPTSDGLPLIPYHRESRRIKGLVRFNVNDLARPFKQETALYRTGIAVGDYPVDHHHAAYPDTLSLPDLHFYPVPSYSLPLGTLIPKTTQNFIVAEKSISVTNLVNGTTRLQPVCLLIGQAAGALAALSAQQNKSPENVSVRLVQNELLQAGAFLMPYSDVEISRTSFDAIQRIGACGILKGEGKNIGWENHTHFYPDSVLTATALKDGLQEWLLNKEVNFESEEISLNEAVLIIEQIAQRLKVNPPKSEKQILKKHGFPPLAGTEIINREMFSVLLDEMVNPFINRDVNHLGRFIEK